MSSSALLYSLTLVYFCISVQSDVRPEWGLLSKQSSVIVVGVVEETFRVKPKPKQATTKQLPDGKAITELPSRDELEGIGRVYRLRVEEIIKGAEPAKTGKTIDIFVPGIIPYEGGPLLLDKKRYLIFLNTLKTDSNNLKDTTISQFDKPSGKGVPFDTTHAYTISMSSSGIVLIEDKTKHVVDEVKTSLSTVQ